MKIPIRRSVTGKDTLFTKVSSEVTALKFLPYGIYTTPVDNRRTALSTA